MIPVAEAIAKVASGVGPLTAEQVALPEALGRVLAEDVASRLTQPFADVSAMDGYAVRAADVADAPATLTLIGQSAAGHGFAGTLGAGQAVRIFTGAPVPAGADAIVIQEDTEASADRVTVREGAPVGRYVRRAGGDFTKGEVLLKAGRMLSARDIGIAAAMNVPWLMVHRRPRVAVLSTGDEVVMPGDPLGPSQIVSSNSLALAAYVRVLGGEPVNLGIARDSEESLRALAAGARGADLLVTIGGASVGDHDLVRKVLGAEGLELSFYTIAMRPGKPLIFGHFNGIPMLGLPGNPVSAGVCSVLFMRPALRVMLGLPAVDELPYTALLGRDVGANDRREDYLRASLSRDASGALLATPFDRQDSNLMALFAKADCLVVRPPFAPPARQGEKVRIVPLDMAAYAI
jgi:molybdopterin molybdotransferase